MYRSKEYLKTEYIDKGRTEQSIADEWGISPKLLHYYIKRNELVGLKSRRKYSVNESKFSISDPVFCYYAGLIVTDGYVDFKNHRVTVSVRNEGSKEVFEKLKSYFEFTGEVQRFHECNTLMITSDTLIQRMRLFGIKQEYSDTKTYSLRFPKLFVNDTCKRMFCRGVLDGDGNIHYSTNTKNGSGQFRIVESSGLFIKGLIRLLNKQFGFEYEVSIFKSRNVEYPKLEMKSQDSMLFYRWVYQGYEEYRFKDKYDRFQELKLKI